jgi:hypothetical protein
MYYQSNQISLLVGKTIESIADDDHRILFVCTDGSAFEMYHMQDCCESVSVYDIKGDLQSIVGGTVIAADESASGDWPADVPTPKWLESFTWTTYVIQTDRSISVIRWLGQSNGYYSESVYFGMTHRPIGLKDADLEDLS